MRCWPSGSEECCSKYHSCTHSPCARLGQMTAISLWSLEACLQRISQWKKRRKLYNLDTRNTKIYLIIIIIQHSTKWEKFSGWLCDKRRTIFHFISWITVINYWRELWSFCINGALLVSEPFVLCLPKSKGWIVTRKLNKYPHRQTCLYNHTFKISSWTSFCLCA